MIPDDITTAIRRIQSGQGDEQDIQMVTSWYAVNQGSLDTDTSTTLSSILGRARATQAGSQIGTQNQAGPPSPSSYLQPGTPSSLPSGQQPGRPSWDTGAGISPGIPSTDLNLEASGNTYLGPGMDAGLAQGAYPPEVNVQANPGAFPGISSTYLEGMTSSLGRQKQTMYDETDPEGNAGIGSLLNSPDTGLPMGWETNSPNINAFKDYQDQLAGTPMEGMGPAGIEMLMNDPAVFAQMLAESGGGGPNAAAFLGPRGQGAMNLAGMGILGHATRGAPGAGSYGQNLTSAPSSDIEKALAAQAFMQQFDQPGTQFADVNALYQESFNRANNTNFEGMTDQNGNPLSLDGAIQMTNDALFAAAPFMSQETQAWISSTLNAAATQYKLQVGKGEIDMSYPAYLKSLGIDQMLASQ